MPPQRHAETPRLVVYACELIGTRYKTWRDYTTFATQASRSRVFIRVCVFFFYLIEKTVPEDRSRLYSFYKRNDTNAPNDLVADRLCAAV